MCLVVRMLRPNALGQSPCNCAYVCCTVKGIPFHTHSKPTPTDPLNAITPAAANAAAFCMRLVLLVLLLVALQVTETARGLEPVGVWHKPIRQQCDVSFDGHTFQVTAWPTQ
jgi:hypothetical protein